jgi:hypothetical protein
MLQSKKVICQQGYVFMDLKVYKIYKFVNLEMLFFFIQKLDNILRDLNKLQEYLFIFKFKFTNLIF